MQYSIKFSHLDETSDWKAYVWIVLINKVAFEYKTGLGHATKVYDYSNKSLVPKKNPKPKDIETIRYTSNGSSFWLHVPKIEQVLHCLFIDCEAGTYSFNEFCDNLGCDNDSIKSFEVYRACEETQGKLKKALGEEFQAKKQEIAALDL